MVTDNAHILSRLAVAVIDDHEVVLEGLKSYLSGQGIGCVKAYGNASMLLLDTKSHLFDIYVIDVELSDTDADTLIDEIRKIQPEAKVIVHTMHEEMWVVRRMTEKNVDGVVYKDGHLSQLLEAIVVVAEGRKFFCRKFKQSREWSMLQNDVLTRREIEVVKAIALGLSTKEIAKRLFISENTVESHRQNISEKLHSRGVADLVIKAIAAGYIKPEAIARKR